MSTPPSFDPQPCCDSAAGAACSQPMQFCQTSSTTGPVEHPGRQYDLTLPINQGFTVDQLLIDATTHPAGITWSIFDVDGSTFATDLQSFIQGRMPSGSTVTVTNPNAGVTEICGPAQPFQIHIECLRLDQNPPNLVELLYNAGEDLITNAGYNTTPPTDLSQGQFHYLQRQDAGGTLNCTSVANRGWETNDFGPNSVRDFEVWGTGPGGLAALQNTTPTPRGTPVQEIAADINDTGSGPTIWQTFNVPAPGNFRVQLVHGARDSGETHTIRLSTGDTNDTGPGDIINDVTTPPSVTSSGGPNPWTTLNQTVPLNSGLYTFSLTTTTPVGPNRGGLFTDMRVYLDRPNTRATATTNDDTCVVTVDETTNNTACSFWTPNCSGGQIASWTNVRTQVTLTNDEFWAQTPTPSCCLPQAAEGGGGGGGISNMAVSDVVCATVGGVPQNVIRTVVLDPSGGQLSQTFTGTDGSPIAPTAWTAGSCTDARFLSDEVLCDVDPGTGDVITSFLRKYVQTWTPQAGSQITETRDFSLDGTARYTPVGTVQVCDSANRPFAMTGLCLADGTPIAAVYHRAGNQPAMDGWVNLNTGSFTAGAPPLGTVACGESRSIQVTGVFCDLDGGGNVLGLVLIEYSYNPDGTIASVRLVNATTGATYVPSGTIGVCPAGTDTAQDTEVIPLCDVVAGTPIPFLRRQTYANGVVTGTVDTTPGGAAYTVTGTVAVCTELDAETQVLCDAGNANHPYIRRITYNTVSGLQVGTNTTNLDGSAYTVVGPEGTCSGTDAESLILCDSAVTPVRFLRTYRYTSAGAVAGFTDTTLAGAAFTPTGAVGVCATAVTNDTDFVEEVMSDANGTCFLRLFRFNSATGALISATNTTLAGAAFTPVGAVTAGCGTCCPEPIGNGCTNTGSGFYTAIRAANGTVSLIDSVSGAAITAGNIIPCPSDDTVLTLSAQGRLVGDADAAWTPGADVVGALTSVTMTVLSGTATVADASGSVLTGLPAGYTATWTVADENTLTGPQSIDAVGGNTVVVWTQRP